MRFPLGPAALLALLGTFLLPFIDLSCQGRQIMTMTGYEVAFGKTMTADLPISKWLGEEGRNSSFRIQLKDSRRTDGRPIVAAALIAAVVGGLLGLGKPFLGALGGIAAVVLLLYAQADMQKEMQQQQVPMVVLTFQVGFWASVSCAAAGGILCLMRGSK